MFGVQSFGNDAAFELFKPTELNQDYVIAKRDLSCFMDDSGSTIEGIFNFATSLYDRLTIERMVSHYLLVLEQMVDNKDRLIKDYKLLSQTEFQQIIIDWNKTDVDYPKEKTIHQLFEEQVVKTPDSIAVVFEEQKLTYAELNIKSNQLARYLQSQITINPDTLIGLCLDRSLEMIIGILGILKAGGAYVPLDPKYPEERIKYILEDTNTSLVLTQSYLIENIRKITTIDIIDLESGCYSDKGKTNILIKNGTSNLAYVIYTSGTTGKPKGVMVSHQAVNNYNNWIYSHNCYSKANIIDCSSSFSFDATVNVLITPLCHGQQVILCTEVVKKDINLFLDHVNRKKIELIKITPSYLSNLLSHTRAYGQIEYLKCIILGGEKANKVDIQEFIGLNPEIEILHHYGPTETTVGVTSFIDFTNNTLLDNISRIPIGKISSNNQAYVLDKNNAPVPIGVTGELHIGGAGLARGYLNRPELTAQKFIPNPFITEEAKTKGYTKLYKTGDLVRWLPDGNLDYIGRNDHQVKIRGYRIELGEIESVIKSIDEIKQVCVLVKEKNDNRYLVAYFVLEKSTELKNDLILRKLSIQLPDYMLPDAFVQLEKFPLTINGKLDHRLFPNYEFTNEETYLAPSTKLDIKLSSIWQEVLKLGKVGMSDDFFRIGGNSILAIKLSHKISENLDIQIAIADIFKYRTIQELSNYISNLVIEEEYIEIEL